MKRTDVQIKGVWAPSRAKAGKAVASRSDIHAKGLF